MTNAKLIERPPYSSYTESAVETVLKGSTRPSRAALPQPSTGHIVGFNEGQPIVQVEGKALRARVCRRLCGKLTKAELDCEVLLVWSGEVPVVVDFIDDGPDVAQSTVDAFVDGRRLQIEGKDEVVLKCGAASITLRRNGRVVIRGTYVETRAKGTNRIKGGSVQIN